jgi:hypothetical protein
MSFCDYKSRRLHPSFLKKAPDAFPAGRQLRGSVLASSCSGVGDRSSAAAERWQARNASCSAGYEALVSRFYPLFVQSHASGHIRRPAARRRSAFRTPLPKQVWAPFQNARLGTWEPGSSLGLRQWVTRPIREFKHGDFTMYLSVMWNWAVLVSAICRVTPGRRVSAAAGVTMGWLPTSGPEGPLDRRITP